MAELTFEGQRENEKVALVFRRHISTAKGGLFWLVIVMGLGYLPMVMWPGQQVMFWIFFGATILGILGFCYSLMLWYFSLYIVTDQRIRQVVQKGLFRKTVVDLGLDKVASISMNVPGLLAGLGNYGTIIIQTAVGDLVISKVKNVKKVYDAMQNVFAG
ncbi:PH domain-containing protein [Candidatus Saccharibacteria bacterium]|nr:PH domain-containing protein [Candidatus Saccharibacteria bacterium]MBR1795973.1 PH domain-containing protein [Candidatus Saccharibacteria bacterium]